MFHKNFEKKKNNPISYLLTYIMLWALGPSRLLVLVLYFICTAHICIIYKGTDVYSLIKKYNTNHLVFLTWYQSHYSNLFLTVMSLLVWLPFQYRFRHHNSRRNLSPLNLQRLPVVVLEFQTCSCCRWGEIGRASCRERVC